MEISLNISKTELILFKPKAKKLDFDLKLNSKRIYPTKSVKYLGIKTDENLFWIDHINDIAIKLNMANARLREFVKTKIVKSVCYAIFDCQLNYANTGWVQNRNSMNWLIILQKKVSVLLALNAEMLIQILFF